MGEFRFKRKQLNLREWRCRDCFNEYKKAWRADNRGRLLAKRRAEYAEDPQKERDRMNARRAADPEKHRARDRAHYAKNREAKAAYSKAWWRRNRDACKERNRQRYKDNPEYYRAASRSYYARNTEKAKAAYKRWAAANKDVINHHTRKRNARIKNATIHPFTVEQLDQRMSMFGYRCIYCGGDFEEVDHFKPLTKGGAHALANLRPSCKSCNCSKGNKWPAGG